jgi:hypothetical protein
MSKPYKSNRAPPRRRLVAYACVGSHGWPFSLRTTTSPIKGQLEIFETHQEALPHAMGPSFVRKVTILIDREPLKEPVDGKV